MVASWREPILLPPNLLPMEIRKRAVPKRALINHDKHLISRRLCDDAKASASAVAKVEPGGLRWEASGLAVATSGYCCAFGVRRGSASRLTSSRWPCAGTCATGCPTATSRNCSPNARSSTAGGRLATFVFISAVGPHVGAERSEGPAAAPAWTASPARSTPTRTTRSSCFLLGAQPWLP